MAKIKTNEIPSILSFEKKLVPSDGRLYGVQWKDRLNNGQHLSLQEISVRGTNSSRLKKAMKDDPAKLDHDVENANLQTIDTCALSNEQDTLKLSFTLKILGNVENPTSCNSEDFLISYQKAVNQYKIEEGFTELAKRYATNIANARYLWRNRAGTDQIEVTVNVLNRDDNSSWTFDAKKINTRHFDHDNPDILSLADKLSAVWCGERDFLLIEIIVCAQIGFSQPVYPSQELILNKGNSKLNKSRVLYQLDGTAGIHTQKIGNALRTIDTWYPGYENANLGPIAIEPYGSVTSLGKAFRHPKEKADFYTLFDRFSRGGTLERNERHYVMATLLRGGVFGKSAAE